MIKKILEFNTHPLQSNGDSLETFRLNICPWLLVCILLFTHKHLSRYFHSLCLIYSLQHPRAVDVINPIFQMRKLRCENLHNSPKVTLLPSDRAQFEPRYSNSRSNVLYHIPAVPRSPKLVASCPFRHTATKVCFKSVFLYPQPLASGDLDGRTWLASLWFLSRQDWGTGQIYGQIYRPLQRQNKSCQ
jgi:hypothetical protein